MYASRRRGPATWLLTVFLLALLAPAIAAQSDASVLLLEDAAGDLTPSVGDVGGPNVASAPASKDLASLHLREGQEDLTFRVEYHPQDMVGEAPTNDLQIGFRHGQQRYVLDLADSTGQNEGDLLRIDGAGNAVRVAAIALTDLDENRVIEATAQRKHLIDESGAFPRPGSGLDEFWVLSQAPASPVDLRDADLAYHDAMPDEGVGDVSYEFQLGPVSTGSARVFSPAPARSSNGEAGIFLFQVVAVNEGDARETFLLKVADKPEPFQVTITEPRFDLEPGASRSVAVVASIPFQHQHGAFESFNITLQSVADADSHSRVELGIRYHAIPQPAGHHDTLWLHAHDDPDSFSPALGSPGSRVFMNALENDPNDHGVPIRAYSDFANRDSFTWRIELTPSLDIGLDFDLERVGTLEVPISTELPLVGTQVTAEFYHERPGSEAVERILLAAGAESEATDMQAGERRFVAIDLAPEPSADYVPYAPESQLVLDLRMDLAVPVARNERQTPAIEPGGSVRLPLNEFLDEVDDAFLAPGAFEVVAPRVQALINPGKTVVYDVELRNTLGGDQRIDLDLEGLNTAWARIASPSTIDLGAGETHALQVVVSAPPDAPDSDVSDVVLVATSLETGERSLTRFLTIVDVDAEYLDEVALAAEVPGKATPAPGVALLVALVGVAARVARRR